MLVGVVGTYHESASTPRFVDVVIHGIEEDAGAEPA
jgi:hypothetical protein